MRDLGTGEFARQVDGDQQSEAPSRTSTTTNTGTTSTAPTRQGTNQGSSSSSSTQQQGTRQPYVRKVSVFHIGDPPQSFPEEFALSAEEEELEIEYCGRIMHAEGKPVEMHVMFVGDQEDDDDDVQWMNDELYQ